IGAGGRGPGGGDGKRGIGGSVDQRAEVQRIGGETGIRAGGQAADAESDGVAESAPRRNGQGETGSGASLDDARGGRRGDGKLQMAAVFHPEDPRVDVRTALVRARGEIRAGQEAVDIGAPIGGQEPAAVEEVSLDAAAAVHVHGKGVGAEVNDIDERIAKGNQRWAGKAVVDAVEGAVNADNVILGVNLRRLAATGAGRIVAPIVYQLPVGHVLLIVGDRGEALGDGGLDDGVVLGDAAGVVAEKFVGFGEPLEAAGEHHLAVVGSHVFVEGGPGGIAGGNNEAGAGLDEPLEEILVVGLVAFAEVIGGTLKISDAVAVGIAVGNGDI